MNNKELVELLRKAADVTENIETAIALKHEANILEVEENGGVLHVDNPSDYQPKPRKKIERLKDNIASTYKDKINELVDAHNQGIEEE